MSELMKDLANGDDDEENKHLLESNLEENNEENEEEFAALPTYSGDSIFFEPDFKVGDFFKNFNNKFENQIDFILITHRMNTSSSQRK
jgi:hypothetical protein